jgi:hypothetical protein
MNLVYVALAEYASKTEDGGINVMSFFDTLGTSDLPLVMPSLYVILMLESDAERETEDFEVSLECSFLDPTGEPTEALFKSIGKLRMVHSVTHVGHPKSARAFTMIRGAEFPNYGTYEVAARVNEGDPVKTWLDVRPL